LFFFSSRRRHTRFSRDWSSDVCSSDLGTVSRIPSTSVTSAGEALSAPHASGTPWPSPTTNHLVPLPRLVFPTQSPLFLPARNFQIGRASCRERGETCRVSLAVTNDSQR